MTISEAITIYLKHYPASNKTEFDTLVESETDRNAVQTILDETAATPIEWGNKSLVEIGQEAEAIIHQRHPELTPQALKHLVNYFTYLVK